MQDRKYRWFYSWKQIFIVECLNYKTFHPYCFSPCLFKELWDRREILINTIWYIRYCSWLIDWLIDCILLIVPFRNISFVQGRLRCRWRAVYLRHLLGTYGLWTGRDLYRAIPAKTGDLGLHGLVRRSARLVVYLRQNRGPIHILTGIPKGWDENVLNLIG